MLCCKVCNASLFSSIDGHPNKPLVEEEKGERGRKSYIVDFYV